jgi:uncharacterized protein with GYD domain
MGVGIVRLIERMERTKRLRERSASVSLERLIDSEQKSYLVKFRRCFYGENVPLFVVLGNWTDEGLKNAKDAPGRIRDTRDAVAKAGGKMQLYYTLGEYDFIMVLEVPDDKAIMKILLWLGGKGNVRTKTLKAWTEDEAAKVISDLKQF